MAKRKYRVAKKRRVLYENYEDMSPIRKLERKS